MAKATRILILGGGFAGVNAATELERCFAGRPDVQITLVSRDNFLLFTPMLHEVASSDLDITTIVNPIRKMLRRAQFMAADVESIDLDARRVVVVHGLHRHEHALEYEQLVLALGAVTNFYGIEGLEDRALTMKSLEDAIRIRNRMIAHLEEADPHCSTTPRDALLTLVVAGGGFAGVEAVGGMLDFMRSAYLSPALRESCWPHTYGCHVSGAWAPGCMGAGRLCRRSRWEGRLSSADSATRDSSGEGACRKRRGGHGGKASR